MDGHRLLRHRGDCDCVVRPVGAFCLFAIRLNVEVMRGRKVPIPATPFCGDSEWSVDCKTAQSICGGKAFNWMATNSCGTAATAW